jgi:predicted AAA+ superfamily ATPase
VANPVSASKLIKEFRSEVGAESSVQAIGPFGPMVAQLLMKLAESIIKKLLEKYDVVPKS